MNFLKIPLVVVFLSIMGCMAVPGNHNADETLAKTLSEKYRAQAVTSEKKHELRKAFIQWRIVRQLEPGDVRVAEKVGDLKAKTRQEADRHFKKGVKYTKKKAITAARKEFLTVLAYDPEHSEAAHYLRYRLNRPAYSWYEARKGDTFNRIAQKTYGNQNVAFLIADVNDMTKGQRLQQKKRLKLPALDEVFNARQKSPDSVLSKALKRYRAGHYEKAVELLENALAYNPDNEEARVLLNKSNYALGSQYLEWKAYQKALLVFNGFDEPYRDVAGKIRSIEKEIDSQAEAHYRQGVRFFLQERLDRAIAEWEAVVQLKPGHQKAQREIEKARRVLESLKKY